MVAKPLPSLVVSAVEEGDHWAPVEVVGVVADADRMRVVEGSSEASDGCYDPVAGRRPNLSDA